MRLVRDKKCSQSDQSLIMAPIQIEINLSELVGCRRRIRLEFPANDTLTKIGSHLCGYKQHWDIYRVREVHKSEYREICPEALGIQWLIYFELEWFRSFTDSRLSWSVGLVLPANQATNSNNLFDFIGRLERHRGTLSPFDLRAIFSRAFFVLRTDRGQLLWWWATMPSCSLSRKLFRK